jgi:hypothetical protein
MKRKLVGLLAAVAAASLGGPAAARAGQFGTRCQEKFDSNWKPTLSHAYERCAGFNDRMDDHNTGLFYFQLNSNGGFTSSDGSAGQGGVDAVDVFYVCTHGGVNSTDARLALRPVNTRSLSSTWRFGDNSDQVAILSHHACKTMAVDDNSYARWDNVFKGGLYLATGSQGTLIDAWETDDAGYDYADNLTHGVTVKWAWFDGNWDWWYDQDLALKASSSGALASCQSRRDTMTGQNIGTFTRLRDGQMNRICSAWIDNY